MWTLHTPHRAVSFCARASLSVASREEALFVCLHIDPCLSERELKHHLLIK